MANRAVLWGRTMRRLSGYVLFVSIAAFPHVARAANNCPWLTEATASGLIGAESVGSYTSPVDAQPAVCTFTQKDGSEARSLTITVEVAKDPHVRMSAVAQTCGRDVASLNAIGNEAVYCAAQVHGGETGERAVGRVRDQVFTIVLHTRAKNDPILTRDVLKARIYTAAEQVAGNLF